MKTIFIKFSPQPVRRQLITKELPLVGVTENGNVSIEQSPDGEIHVYAHPDEDVIIHQKDKASGKVQTDWGGAIPRDAT